MKINMTLVKRVLAIVLGAALALLLLPIPVFAQDSPASSPISTAFKLVAK